MTIKDAALKILKPHLPAMRAWRVSHPMPPPPERRVWPPENVVWRTYVSATVTAMTRDTPALWAGMDADTEWIRLMRKGPDECPSLELLQALLARHRIRFPAQKALRIRRSVDRDFAGLAKAMRETFARVHDKRLNQAARRRAEIDLAVQFQKELSGCGVAPKIARLALMRAEEVTQVIPIDSRWQNALAEQGVEVTPGQLSHESRYRVIEDELCAAAHELGVWPKIADWLPFGWLLPEGK
jgi:hypothetical protein